eukprot:689667-Amphidinium_carterae.4
MEDVELEEETIAAKLARRVAQPTETEVAEHIATGHSSFRSWCRACVESRGIGQQHRARDHTEESMSVVSFDYGFLGAEGDESAITVLAAVDRQSRCVLGTALPRKGGTTFAVEQLSEFIKSLGYKRLALRCDQEEAALNLRKLTRAALTDVEIVEEMSPVMDHQANGAAENAVKRIKGQAATLVRGLEHSLGKEIPPRHPLAIMWSIKHGADCINRYRVGGDGRTSEELRTGRKWHRIAIPYGESVMGRKLGTTGKKQDLAARSVEGLFLGYSNKSGNSLLLTQQGVVQTVGLTRRATTDHWHYKDNLEDYRKGLPWAWQMAEEEAEAPTPATVPVIGEPLMLPARDPQAKAFYVKRSNVERYGTTPGCRACLELLSNGTASVAHSAECRDRIVSLMREQRDPRVEVQEQREHEAEVAGDPGYVEADDKEAMQTCMGEQASRD